MQNTAPQVDLLIRNGRVIDPEQGIDRVRDLAILEGKMVDVPRTEQVTARSVVDARSIFSMRWRRTVPKSGTGGSTARRWKPAATGS